MLEALAELERQALEIGDSKGWLPGERISQPDITVACASTFAHEALQLDAGAYPALHRRVGHCEALPVFAEFHLPFFPPAART
jgi:glutathione S-transferase